ncbi:MAG: hypothetical protein LBO79_07615, partial [Zoogloeaceae bacterium]|nr:hypothetical protein [Zoogloeaceae bacterium]
MTNTGFAWLYEEKICVKSREWHFPQHGRSNKMKAGFKHGLIPGASDNKNFVWHRKWISKPRWLGAVALLLLSTMISWPLESNAMEFEETVFKT